MKSLPFLALTALGLGLTLWARTNVAAIGWKAPVPLEQFHLPHAKGASRVNHPANLAATYSALAGLRGLPLATLALQVEKNFCQLFGGEGTP